MSIIISQTPDPPHPSFEPLRWHCLLYCSSPIRWTCDSPHSTAATSSQPAATPLPRTDTFHNQARMTLHAKVSDNKSNLIYEQCGDPTPPESHAEGSSLAVNTGWSLTLLHFMPSSLTASPMECTLSLETAS